MLPLKEMVIYPDTLTPLAVGQPRSMRLVNEVLSGERMLALVAARDPELDEPGPDELYDVGVVGIVNTMLMSTTERFTEFGVLRTNGWSRGNVLTLVTAESAYLGLLAGLVGCLLAVAGTAIANQFLGGGLKLTLSPQLFGLGILLSVVMGTAGGLYPAWTASRLVPMDAIRMGAH